MGHHWWMGRLRRIINHPRSCLISHDHIYTEVFHFLQGRRWTWIMHQRVIWYECKSSSYLISRIFRGASMDLHRFFFLNSAVCSIGLWCDVSYCTHCSSSTCQISQSLLFLFFCLLPSSLLLMSVITCHFLTCNISASAKAAFLPGNTWACLCVCVCVFFLRCREVTLILWVIVKTCSELSLLLLLTHHTALVCLSSGDVYCHMMVWQQMFFLFFVEKATFYTCCMSKLDFFLNCRQKWCI